MIPKLATRCAECLRPVFILAACGASPSRHWMVAAADRVEEPAIIERTHVEKPPRHALPPFHPTLRLQPRRLQKAPEAAQVVVWPELTAFDEIAAKAEGLAQVGDVAALRQTLPDMVKTGSAVTAATIPVNAKNPAGLKSPLADLAELITKLSAAPLNDDDLKTYTLALHPLVAVMMTEAGMPHIHANEGPHGGFFHPVFAADGKQAATLEIKLHDDAGDLEVWLVRGGRDGPPLDLPLDSVLKFDFPI